MYAYQNGGLPTPYDVVISYYPQGCFIDWVARRRIAGVACARLCTSMYVRSTCSRPLAAWTGVDDLLFTYSVHNCYLTVGTAQKRDDPVLWTQLGAGFGEM